MSDQMSVQFSQSGVSQVNPTMITNNNATNNQLCPQIFTDPLSPDPGRETFISPVRSSAPNGVVPVVAASMLVAEKCSCALEPMAAISGCGFVELRLSC